MTDDFGFSLDDIIDTDDIPSICLNCGLEEIIPGFIYDEFCEMKKHKELKTNRKISTICCNRCGKLKTVSKYWLTHI